MVERVHPLAEIAAASPVCSAVQLTALPAATRLIVRAHPSPPDVCRASVNGDHALLWLGPGEYLLIAPEGAAIDAKAAVDVSHRNTAIGVAGPRAAWVINAFCALDLHPSAFPVGMCTRTVFGKAQITVWRTGAETFRVEAGRSFLPYVWDYLAEAAREFSG